MYKNNVYRSKNRRPGVSHFGPSRRQKNKKPAGIDPARYVKTAERQDDEPAYQSQYEFGDFAMHPLLKSNITAKGYAAPSEIQDKTIALGLEGRSVVGIANTGTGKTAAFALPILNKLMRNPGGKALIIAPTRELAMQIEEQCKLLAKNSGLNGALLIGGSTMSRQKNDLKRGPRIVIGTPGRIKDLINQGFLQLQNCDMVVLDEVDRMLDMGFINDVRFILGKLPPKHQAFFFSATISPEIESLIKTFTDDAVLINVKSGETSRNVNQDVVYFSGKADKIDKLHDILIGPDVTKAIVFGKTKYGVERLGKELISRGFKANSIHGGKNQAQRSRALDGFKDSHTNVLVATDVAARGIDVKDISHVINYDQPQTYDDYVHRIGRAGRQDRPGTALTFVEKP